MEIPSDNELLAKDKAELDKLKVILDIAGFKEKQKSDRVRYRQETLRLFIIAVLSGFITFGSTYVQKNTERRLKKVDDQESMLQNLFFPSKIIRSPSKPSMESSARSAG